MAVKDESSTSISEAAKLRVSVKLVLARVVVRDSKGNSIGNLQKDDFELFDNGKPQIISSFDVHHGPGAPAASTSTVATNAVTPVENPPTLPLRYVVYLFDDLHLNFGDLSMVRTAANRRFEALAPTERVAIYSTSGQTSQDFTDDRSQLVETAKKLMPRPLLGSEINPCPDISFYMADYIVNKHDPDVLQTAINNYVNCAHPPAQLMPSVPSIVESYADQALQIGEHESRLALGVLQNVVRRVSAMPGQRALVLVSPGFLTPELEYDYNDIIDRALRGQVVISSLDARGLYTVIPGGDASNPGDPDVPIPGQRIPSTPRSLLDTQEAAANDDILAVLAYSTGGTFFHNNNDMNEGLRRVADLPESYYMLGFTPQNLKLDGKFHTLKVTLKTKGKFDLQSRRGYFAPKHDIDAAEEAKREIEDEVLSSEELHDLPVALHTQFFKAADNSAKLTVLARVDVKRLHYKQTENRSENKLTIVTAVFDRNGNFMEATEKTVEMKWKSETLQNKLSSGITLKSSFDVKPGRYLVRVVARDSEQQVMSAENGAVEIP